MDGSGSELLTLLGCHTQRPDPGGSSLECVVPPRKDIFYLIQYIQHILISTCNQYKELSVIYFIFFVFIQVFKIRCTFYTYSAFQFGPVTFSSAQWLVAGGCCIGQHRSRIN